MPPPVRPLSLDGKRSLPLNTLPPRSTLGRGTAVPPLPGMPPGMTKGGASIELEGLAFKPTAIRMDRSKRVAAPPGVQKWLKIERSGRTSILQVDKHIIAQETGVQVCDPPPPPLSPFQPLSLSTPTHMHIAETGCGSV